MKNISYKNKLTISYLLIILALIFSLIYIFKSLHKSDVSNISKKHFETKISERENYFNDHFLPYYASIKALNQNPDFKNYAASGENIATVQNIFMQIKRSLPCLTQARFINKQGKESIRIDGTAAGFYKENATSRVVSQDRLQDKSGRYYFKDFMKLKPNELGLSKIDLNIEHGKISLPKQPTLRLGMAVYGKNQNKLGVLVYNICLRTLFKSINKTTLYHIHLIDKNGTFLNHHDSRYGLLGDDQNYSLKDEFPNEFQNILNNDTYYGKRFYSKKISGFENGQKIKILLELKFDKMSQENLEQKESFLYILTILSLLILPLIIYFGKLPDKIMEKANKDKYVSNLSSLPNRLALMKDLMDQNYEKSVIILVSINNIIKIQNSYGYAISNELILQISKFLSSYDDENIEKVYMNSYQIFSLKYNLTDMNRLNRSVKKLHKDIENHIFNINLDDTAISFSINCTIGCSDPHNLNNSIYELQEAENALDNALDKNLKTAIYDTSHFMEIEKNKCNITLSKEIKNAVKNNDITIHFQPIYNNRTEKIEKYESLIRMKLNGELKYPDEFLPVAKDINQYEALSFVVIDKSCSYFSDKDYEFSVNLSILDVSNKEFQKYLIERIEHYKVAHKIVLEIVESEGIENYDEFLKFIKKIKQTGCKIAIDDFGSGYSNFEYIIKLSEYIDYLKIDGSLIKNITQNPNTQILVGSLKFLCDNLQIETIAEYVESEEIIKYLKSIGIDYSQGYYIGRPTEEI